LRLNVDFQKLLDELVTPHSSEPTDKRSGDPCKRRLFVLPVDDVDLNPQRCLELLQLFRTISSPQLFLIVLGDFALTEMVVRQRTCSEFGVQPTKESENEDSTGKAAQVSAATLRKCGP